MALPQMVFVGGQLGLAEHEVRCLCRTQGRAGNHVAVFHAQDLEGLAHFFCTLGAQNGEAFRRREARVGRTVAALFMTHQYDQFAIAPCRYYL